MASSAFLIWAAPWANTSGHGEVPAPAMKRGALKRLAVPQSSLIPVSFCFCSARPMISSKAAFVASSVSSSGAMSRSWKHQ